VSINLNETIVRQTAMLMTLTSEMRWYAVHTQARHEKVVAQRLSEKGIESFLPLVTSIHRWSDRTKKVELPLFSCYVFARIGANNEQRQQVCRIVEIGISDLARAVSIIEVAQRFAGDKKVWYTGIDFFEARDPSNTPLPLKETYRILRATEANVRLVPGSPASSVAAAATPTKTPT